MKKFLIGIVVVVVLVGGALLIAPSFIDWNKERDQITQLAKDYTGREVKITGDISATILPSPRVAISGLEIASIDGTQQPYLARIKEVEIIIALAPLFSGVVKVESIFIEGPDIALEQLPDGRNNWSFESTDTEPAAPAEKETSSGGFGQFELSLQNIVLRNGRIAFRDRGGEIDEAVENIQFSASVASLKGPYTLAGDLTARELGIGYDIKVGRVDGSGKLPLRLGLALKDVADTKLSFVGQLDLTAPAPAANGALNAQVDNLASLLAKFQSVSASTPGLAKPLKLEAKVAGDQSRLNLTDLRLELGNAKADGSILALLGTPLEVTTELELRGLNLDELMAPSEAAKPADAAKPIKSADQPFWPALPNDIIVDAKIKANGITYRKALIRQTKLEARLADGRLDISRLSALLPGGSDVNVAAILSPPDTDPRLKGRFEMASGNLRGLMGWLGSDVQTPSGRLANFTATMDFEGQENLLQAKKINLRLDGSSLTGSASYRLQGRPSFGINLLANRINLDGYLPLSFGGEEPQASSQNPSAQGGGLDLSALNGFDADIKVALKQLTYQRKTMKGLRFDAQLFNGNLTLRDVGIKNIGGGGLNVVGKAGNFGGAPNADLNIEAKAGNLSTVASFLGLDLGVPASRLTKFSLEMALKGDAGQFQSSGRVSLAGSKLSFDGRVKDLTASPNGQVKFDFSHPSLTKFSKNFGLGVKPKKDSPLSLDGLIKGGANLVSLDLKAGLASAKIGVDGTMSDLLTAPSFKLNLTAAGGDMQRVMQGFGLSYQPIRKGKHILKLKAVAVGSPDKLTISNLDAMLGQTTVQGNLQADLSRAKPYAKADLKLGGLVVDEFLAKSARTAKGGRTKRTEARWSRNVVDFSGLKTFDADAELSAAFIHFEPYRLKAPKLTLKVKDGVLSFSPLTAGLFDGQVNASGSLNANTGNKGAVEFALSNIQLKPAIKTISGITRISGSAESAGKLTTTGRSEWEFVRNLAGNVSMRAWDGAIEKLDLKRARNAFENMNNPAVVLQEITAAVGHGRTRFLEIKGDWLVKRGVATTDGIASNFEIAYGDSRGNLDFPRWQMNMVNDLRFSNDQEKPDIVIVMKGPLDNPKSSVKTDVLKNLLGGLLGGSATKTEETITKPVEQLKDALGSLFGKKKQ